MANKKIYKPDAIRDDRISNEIVVDCNDEEDQMSGWWHYLEDVLVFPFTAKCSVRRSISPLQINTIVEVIDMGEFEDCQSEMFVTINWQGIKLGVPLSQLQPIKSNAKNKEAVEDWVYWSKGY